MSGYAGSTRPPTPESTQRARTLRPSLVASRPDAFPLVESRALDLDAELHVIAQLPLVGDAQQVVLNLAGR